MAVNSYNRNLNWTKQMSLKMCINILYLSTAEHQVIWFDCYRYAAISIKNVKCTYILQNKVFETFVRP